MLAKEVISRIYERKDNGFSTEGVKPLLVEIPASSITYKDDQVQLKTQFFEQIKKGLMMDFCGVTYRITEVSKTKELHYFFNVITCEKI